MGEMTFRAKPFEFRAKQWFKDGDHDAVQWAFGEDWFFIQTRQGCSRVDPGDWIITLPDVFAAKYEPADAGPPVDAGDGDAEVAAMHLAKVVEGLPDDGKVYVKGEAEYPVSCVSAKLLRALLAAAGRGPGPATRYVIETLSRYQAMSRPDSPGLSTDRFVAFVSDAAVDDALRELGMEAPR